MESHPLCHPSSNVGMLSHSFTCTHPANQGGNSMIPHFHLHADTDSIQRIESRVCVCVSLGLGVVVCTCTHALLQTASNTDILDPILTDISTTNVAAMQGPNVPLPRGGLGGCLPTSRCNTRPVGMAASVMASGIGLGPRLQTYKHTHRRSKFH